ncbi:pentapeptide repeat-containing protein [Dongia deserti]|uniref:pentapeptide repeat-containing protein n=1 Tax=Dongia deserti TaxID=2268030 RepID=UPI000E65E89B|nr:pentapeptide repeat-containing protein [Dongia deserti]
MAKWAYEFQAAPREPIERGELDAGSEEEARRKLRVLLATPRLPPGTKLVNLGAEKAAAASQRSAKLRTLLRVIAAHHAWLKGKPEGGRANLSRLSFAGLNLHDADLSNAEMREVDLSGCDLQRANLRRANLAGANLQDANLAKADLSEADLSDADLRNADLRGTDLNGADLWRANLIGACISPEALHKALQCRKK